MAIALPCSAMDTPISKTNLLGNSNIPFKLGQLDFLLCLRHIFTFRVQREQWLLRNGSRCRSRSQKA